MRTLNLSAFDALPPIKVQVANAITTATLPSLDEVRSLAHWTSEMVDKFGKDAAWFAGPPKRDRSQALAELAYLSAENRFSDEQMYVVLDNADSRWGKYVGRRDREKRLLDFINRARTKIGYDPIEFDPTSFAKALEDTGDDREVWDLRDFLAADFKIDWVVEGLHPKQGFGLVTGFPGVGKTQFAVGLAMHIAGGSQRFLSWPVKGGPQRVLLLSLEMGKSTIHHLITKISRPYDDMAVDNFKINPKGEALHLDTEEGKTKFRLMLEKFTPRVVVIDSMQKISSKELSDETATKEMMTFLQGCRKAYDCSMIVVHHMRKKSTDQQNKGVELSDVYGSVYLTAEPDWVLNLRQPNPDETPDLLIMSSLKIRNAETLPPTEIWRNAYLGFDLQ